MPASPSPGLSLGGCSSPLPLGVALGLFLGKQVGVFGSCWLAARFGWRRAAGRRIAGPNVYGVAILCGIGFTMSLFIGLLAFPNHPELINEVKLGVIGGSLASALLGASVLWIVAKRASRAEASGGAT